MFFLDHFANLNTSTIVIFENVKDKHDFVVLTNFEKSRKILLLLGLPINKACRRSIYVRQPR